MKPPSACCEALDAAIATRRHIRIDSMTFGLHGRLLGQQQYFAGATLRKRSMRLGGVPKRDPASDRDRQLSRPHGLNRILQVLRVLFGYESDRAYLRIFSCTGRSARDGGEDPARLHFCHKILGGLSPNRVRDDVDGLEIRKGCRIVECDCAISAQDSRAI
jgi:hypothetical protein